MDLQHLNHLAGENCHSAVRWFFPMTPSCGIRCGDCTLGGSTSDEAFEALRIEPFSSPPELPDVMKPQDSGSSANEQAVQ